MTVYFKSTAPKAVMLACLCAGKGLRNADGTGRTN